MARERFVKQDTGSFFGNFIYDRMVRPDHFLRKLNEIIDWKPFTRQLVEYYGGGARYGRPPYDPAVILKMLLIACLYNLSERQTEQHVNDSLAMKSVSWLGSGRSRARSFDAEQVSPTADTECPGRRFRGDADCHRAPSAACGGAVWVHPDRG